MPRRQILSSEEKERLLVVPDDDVLLTRMCFLNEHDIALINKHRRPANRPALLYYSVICADWIYSGQSNIPHSGVISRIASRLKLQPDLWPEYASREQTRWEHLTELYRYLKLSPFSRSLQKTVSGIFTPMPCVLTKDLYLRKKCSAGYITIMLFSLLLM